jgi:predicted 3-demethylubiquinone-9 3-methyltransferase (glyoxalase superfamily)
MIRRKLTGCGAALSEGGKIEQCGWLKDRHGLFWQIVPIVLGEMMKG